MTSVNSRSDNDLCTGSENYLQEDQKITSVLGQRFTSVQGQKMTSVRGQTRPLIRSENDHCTTDINSWIYK